MPIGDLLAQISGDGSSPNPAPRLPTTNSIPKRKADEDLRTVLSKTPRTTSLSSSVAPRASDYTPRPRLAETSTQARTPQSSRPLDRSSSSQRPTNGSASRPGLSSSRPLNGANRVQKPAAPARPSPGPSSGAAASRVPPKKGSFAEILARGQRAQAVMGQVGKIQHKKVEKNAAPPPKKEEQRPDPRAAAKKRQPPQQATGYSGTSKSKPGQPAPRNGASSTATRDNRNAKPPLTKSERAKAAAAEEDKERRAKRAAAATTGYTGTARPKPGASVKKREEHRGGALLNARVQRPRDSRSRSRYDDEDEDMDDFIDYDDEEDDGMGGGGPRYDYASDGSSDMEAGLSDIDVEERRAEVIGRREDVEQERIERNLKAAKDQRKREALEALRSGRRR